MLRKLLTFGNNSRSAQPFFNAYLVAADIRVAALGHFLAQNSRLLVKVKAKNVGIPKAFGTAGLFNAEFDKKIRFEQIPDSTQQLYSSGSTFNQDHDS